MIMKIEYDEETKIVRAHGDMSTSDLLYIVTTLLITHFFPKRKWKEQFRMTCKLMGDKLIQNADKIADQYDSLFTEDD